MIRHWLKMPSPVYSKLYSLEAEGERSETQQKVCAANVHPAAVMAVLLTAVHCACSGHCGRSVSIVVTTWTLPQPFEGYGNRAFSVPLQSCNELPSWSLFIF